MPPNYIDSVSTFKKGLTLLTAATPNGFKATIFLELLGLDYDVKKIDFWGGENKEDWFVKLNPNSKIPTLVVKDESEKVTSIPESAAIVMYLADKYDTGYKYHYPANHELYYEQLSWIFFQMASLGPQQGQAHHFIKYAPEKVPYGIKRYGDEANRIYDVLEYRLKQVGTGYIVGDHLTIVDIITWPWIRSHEVANVSLETRPLLKEWFNKLADIDAFKTGSAIP